MDGEELGWVEDGGNDNDRKFYATQEVIRREMRSDYRQECF